MSTYETKGLFVAHFWGRYKAGKLTEIYLPRFDRHDVEIIGSKGDKSIQIQVQFAEPNLFCYSLEVSTNLAGLSVVSLKDTNRLTNNIEEIFEQIENQLNLLDELSNVGLKKVKKTNYESNRGVKEVSNTLANPEEIEQVGERHEKQ